MMALHRASERQGRLLFVNKKKQKNFANLGRAGFSATGPVETKVFAPLFSKGGCFLYIIWSAL
jgi:hypothetical protein